MTSCPTFDTIRFYGDSWFWNFFGDSIYNFKSNKIKSLGDESQSFPSIKLYLNYFGYNCEVLNTRGSCFYTTVKNLKQAPANPAAKVNVIFFSSLIRRTNFTDFPVHSYIETLNKINVDTISLLNQINDWAETNNQQVLILGGQSTLSVDIFNRFNNLGKINLLTPCLMTEICKIYDQNIKEFGLFKLADFTDKIDESWDKELVHKIYEDITTWDKSILRSKFTWPDTGHLNCTASLIFVDSILSKLEELKIIK